MGEVRLLLIGAGRMGQTHVRALRHSERVRIVAVADPSEEARAIATELDSDLHSHAELAAALHNEQVDGVLIAAPSTLHRHLVAECAERRLPILCEKPCGVSVGDIDAAARAAEAAGVHLQVGYWRRYVPELIQLREQLRAGRFGELLMVSCWQWDASPPEPAFSKSSGGIVIDMAVHELDQIRWLTGEELVPSSARSGAGGEDPDCIAALLKLSGGAAALISLGR